MCAVGRYVRQLDSTIHAIQIKTKVCQLVEAMMLRRDDLTFRQEMKFRNKLVEYLTDWIMGNSHQLNVQGDVFTMSRYHSAVSLRSQNPPFLKVFPSIAIYSLRRIISRNLTTQCLTFTGSGSIRERGRLTQPCWLLGAL